MDEFSGIFLDIFALLLAVDMLVIGLRLMFYRPKDKENHD